jgi:hypothetical protein
MEREKLDWPLVYVSAAALIGAGIMLNITTSGSVGPGEKSSAAPRLMGQKRAGAASVFGECALRANALLSNWVQKYPHEM